MTTIYYYTPIRMGKAKKQNKTKKKPNKPKLTIPSAGEHVEKLELSCIASKKQTDSVPLENPIDFYKTKHTWTMWSSKSTPQTFTQEK